MAHRVPTATGHPLRLLRRRDVRKRQAFRLRREAIKVIGSRTGHVFFRLEYR